MADSRFNTVHTVPTAANATLQRIPSYLESSPAVVWKIRRDGEHVRIVARWELALDFPRSTDAESSALLWLWRAAPLVHGCATRTALSVVHDLHRQPLYVHWARVRRATRRYFFSIHNGSHNNAPLLFAGI